MSYREPNVEEGVALIIIGIAAAVAGLAIGVYIAHRVLT